MKLWRCTNLYYLINQLQGDYKQEGIPEITLKYLTPHNKWSTHSMYFDSQQMLTLFRGGQTIWLNEDDAAEIGVKDNDWVEAFNKKWCCSSSCK